MTKERKNTLWFIGFLLLGGLLHFSERNDHPFLPDTLVYCAVFALYTGLLLFWMQSVRDRLIRSRSRTYTMAAGGFMLLYLLIRTLKYRIVGIPALSRAFWYIYYAPLIMIPTLFLMTCFRFYSGKESPPRERVLLIPAVTLTAGVLTNDLHRLAFRPRVDMSLLIGDTGTYAYGGLYYAVYAWIGFTIALGVFFLLWKAHSLREWEKGLSPLLFLGAIPVLAAANDALWANGFHRVYQTAEIHVFCMLGVFEMCIRNRLMPRNENYPGFFAGMDSPAMVTNADLTPVYRTAAPLNALPDQLRASLKGPLALDEDTLLFGRALSAGCAFWIVDESKIHRLNERLEDANETIGLENRLIQYENEQREEKARLDARNAVYAKAAADLYPTQKKIAALLKKMQPGAPEYYPLMARVCMLNAYVKRKTNFILTYAESDPIDGEELYQAIREITVFLNFCGVFSSVDRQNPGAFLFHTALSLLDTFQTLIETMLPRMTKMMAFLRADSLLMTVNCPPPDALPETPLPVTAEPADGLLFLTVIVPKGGAAA